MNKIECQQIYSIHMCEHGIFVETEISTTLSAAASTGSMITIAKMGRDKEDNYLAQLEE